MKAIIKKTTAFFFILLGFSPLLFVLFLSVKKEQIRHKIKEQFEIQNLQTIVLPENKVIWMDKNEIWINNSMFDIKTKKLESGTYTFTGLYDDAETKLKEIEKNTSGNNKEHNILLAKLFSHLPVFCSQQDELYHTLKPSIVFNSVEIKNIRSPFREIIIPPPQACC